VIVSSAMTIVVQDPVAVEIVIVGTVVIAVAEVAQTVSELSDQIARAMVIALTALSARTNSIVLNGPIIQAVGEIADSYVPSFSH